MEERVEFLSDGLRLVGTLHRPAVVSARLPAMLVLHGFGTNRESDGIRNVAEFFSSRGYAALRFDMRGCGESEGTPARVICQEQVADTRNALTWLAGRSDIDSDRIGVAGHSFGAAVAIYAAGVDTRFACCISSGGWGDGPSKFRRQHASPEAWARFERLLAEGPAYRREHGRSMMVPRYDIVPIPQHLRANLAPGAHAAFPFEVVESMYGFRANEVVGRIAPRPLLLLHASKDSVTPTEQSVELFKRAGQPADLFLVSEVDHFLLREEDPLVVGLLDGWLRKHFPPRTAG